MALADLIRGNRNIQSEAVATAIPATSATEGDSQPATVATVAEVAVASTQIAESGYEAPGCQWRLIEGDRVRELTVVPAETRSEMQRRYPTAVIEVAPEPVVDVESLAAVRALGPLLGERDPEILAGQANPQGAAWLRECALEEFRRNPESAIAPLTDKDAVGAAIEVLAGIHPSEALKRSLGPILPALEARHGSLEHRAVHARRVLALIAADSASLTKPAVPGDAR